MAEARFERVPFGDAHLPTWTWGDPARPAVLLVHGWEGRGAQLASFVPALRAAGFRAVAFDGPGHGRSPLHRSSAAHMALAIERMAQAFGPFAGVVAHSVGGAAVPLALRLGRGALDLGRCVLLAPPVSAQRFFDGFCEQLGLGDTLREAVAARIERELGVAITSIDVRSCASWLGAPMLLLHDEGDREVAFENARTFVSAWPGAKLVVTSGLGHRAILRDPDVVAATAAFIAGKDDVATGLPFGSVERDLFDRSRRWTRAAT
ncbi:MAG TPA: alpha/beta fold hydrolase [Polyangiaceae bacterium]